MFNVAAIGMLFIVLHAMYSAQYRVENIIALIIATHTQVKTDEYTKNETAKRYRYYHHYYHPRPDPSAHAKGPSTFPFIRTSSRLFLS